jgi:hypothetical protein
VTTQERRQKFRKGLNTLYTPYYDALCALLGDEWAPYQGLRTFTEQDQLYSQGRSSPGKVVTNAQGGESAHNYGCATDWCLWDAKGAPSWPSKDDPKWTEYVQAVEKVGLKAGADFGDEDHNELKIDCSWKHILVAFNQNGLRAACEYIEERLAK